jgi:hypothetical protein
VPAQVVGRGYEPFVGKAELAIWSRRAALDVTMPRVTQAENDETATSFRSQDRDARRRLEARADKWGRLVAVLVLVLGLPIIVVPALLHMGDVWENPFVPSKTTVVEITTRPNGTQVRKTTTSEAERSFVERSLAAGGLLLLRLGAVALAAFIAGAVVQRAIMGRFDLKLGPLELAETKRAAEASEEALAAVQDDLRGQVQATEGAMRVAAGAAKGVAALHEEITSLNKTLAVLLTMVGPPPTDQEDSERGSGVAQEPDSDVQFGHDDNEGMP